MARNTIEYYRHDSTRKNNLPAGLAAIYEKPERKAKKCAYDPHIDLQLVWANKAGLKCYEVDPNQSWVNRLYSMRLFASDELLTC